MIFSLFNLQFTPCRHKVCRISNNIEFLVPLLCFIKLKRSEWLKRAVAVDGKYSKTILLLLNQLEGKPSMHYIRFFNIFILSFLCLHNHRNFCKLVVTVIPQQQPQWCMEWKYNYPYSDVMLSSLLQRVCTASKNSL